VAGGRALALSEFDESLHERLVRCLARAGQLGAARHQANMCEVLFRRRAALHQAGLGNRAGIEAARPLAKTIDSPALHDAMRTVG
jgi:hypothetical protein